MPLDSARPARLACPFAAVVLGVAQQAFAHGGEEHPPSDAIWTQWNPAPAILICLLTLSSLYALGIARLWRGTRVGRGVATGRAALFAAGMLSLIVALVSPIDVISDELGSVHMVQHMILMVIAAPLVVLGGPGPVMAWALPESLRSGLLSTARPLTEWSSRMLVQPALAWFAYALILWVWHIPLLYQAALRNRFIHDAQHLMFFAAACLFWRSVLGPVGRLSWRFGPGLLYLFAASLHATVLGVLMALSPVAWYPDYQGRTQVWSLSALEDQQLAGVIMWMPACTLQALLVAALLGIWLRKLEQESDGPPTSTDLS